MRPGVACRPATPGKGLPGPRFSERRGRDGEGSPLESWDAASRHACGTSFQRNTRPGKSSPLSPPDLARPRPRPIVTGRYKVVGRRWPRRRPPCFPTPGSARPPDRFFATNLQVDRREALGLQRLVKVVQVAPAAAGAGRVSAGVGRLGDGHWWQRVVGWLGGAPRVSVGSQECPLFRNTGLSSSFTNTSLPSAPRGLHGQGLEGRAWMAEGCPRPTPTHPSAHAHKTGMGMAANPPPIVSFTA